MALHLLDFGALISSFEDDDAGSWAETFRNDDIEDWIEEFCEHVQHGNGDDRGETGECNALLDAAYPQDRASSVDPQLRPEDHRTAGDDVLAVDDREIARSEQDIETVTGQRKAHIRRISEAMTQLCDIRHSIGHIVVDLKDANGKVWGILQDLRWKLARIESGRSDRGIFGGDPNGNCMVDISDDEAK